MEDQEGKVSESKNCLGSLPRFKQSSNQESAQDLEALGLKVHRKLLALIKHQSISASFKAKLSRIEREFFHAN